MRSFGSDILVLLGWAFALGCGAGEEGADAERKIFVLLIEAKTTDGSPVKGLVVRSATGAEIGRSAEDGRVFVTVAGRDGEAAEFTVQAPPDLALGEGGDRHRVVLRRLRSLSGETSRLNIVAHDVVLRKRKLRYVFLLVMPGRADLPVLVSGTERTRLNSRGIGLFLHEGLPGDEVPVAILESSDLGIPPSSTQRTFVLPDAPAQLFWRTLAKPSRSHRHQEKRRPRLRRIPQQI